MSATHSRLRGRTAIAAALLVMLAGCNTLKGLQVGDVKLDPFVSAAEKLGQSGDMSEADEVSLGGHMAGTLVGAVPLDRNAR